MTSIMAALTVTSLCAVFALNVYFLLRYMIVADSLRKIIGRSSGDGKKSNRKYPFPAR